MSDPARPDLQADHGAPARVTPTVVRFVAVLETASVRDEHGWVVGADIVRILGCTRQRMLVIATRLRAQGLIERSDTFPYYYRLIGTSPYLDRVRSAEHVF